MNKLLTWKSSPRRMPLLIYGARQVGKTYTALTFGKTNNKNTVYNIIAAGSLLGVALNREKFWV